MASDPEPGPVAKVVVSLFFLALGVIAFICAGNSGDPEGKVMCGDEEMAPDDICTTWVNGSAEDRSYDEQADQNDNLFLPVIYVLGGLISIAIGIAGFTDVGSKHRDFDAPAETEWQRSQRAPSRAAPVTAARPPRRSEGEETVLAAISGEDVEIELDRAGITIRTGKRAMHGPGDRVPVRRMDWHEIMALEFDQGSTGMRLSLCAIDRYSGQRLPIADTWAFQMEELQEIAATIERVSDGEARLR